MVYDDDDDDEDEDVMMMITTAASDDDVVDDELLCYGCSDWADDVQCSTAAEHEARAVRLHHAENPAQRCLRRDPRCTC